MRKPWLMTLLVFGGLVLVVLACSEAPVARDLPQPRTLEETQTVVAAGCYVTGGTPPAALSPTPIPTGVYLFDQAGFFQETNTNLFCARAFATGVPTVDRAWRITNLAVVYATPLGINLALQCH